MDLDRSDWLRAREGAYTIAPSKTLTRAEKAEARALMEAIAEKLLARVEMDRPTPAQRASCSAMMCGPGRSPTALSPDALAALFEDEEPPALASFDLSDKDGRLGFLYALFMHHYRHGLFLAVQHVWASLASPKVVRCQIMAQQLKLPGTGKTALKNVLAAFLEETLYGVDFPPLPDTADFPDSAAWNAACTQHFDGINAQFDAIYHRYEAILDGRDANEKLEAGLVIDGPWKLPVRGH